MQFHTWKRLPETSSSEILLSEISSSEISLPVIMFYKRGILSNLLGIV